MKLDRMIGILSILLQQEKVTAPYLAEKFEVSRRTISRDIEQLCMAGIPLVTTQGPNGGIAVMDDYKIDRALLTSSDMQAILAGLQSLDSVSGTNRYAQLMEKLSAGASECTADRQICIDLASRRKTSLSAKIGLLHEAIADTRLVSFTYFPPKGESGRQIEPYRLLFHWSSWYVWGWCLERQAFRLFKLNRMTGLSEGGGFKARPVLPPDLSNETVFPHVYDVKARIWPKCRWRLVEECGPESFAEQPDGTLLVRAGFTDEDMIVSWIISFGEDAELLEPAGLRRRLFSLAGAIREKYKDCTEDEQDTQMS